MEFHGFIESRTFLLFDFYLKDSAFTAVKTDAKF